MWFVTAGITGIILGIKFGISKVPHTLDALTSIMLTIFVLSLILFSPLIILLILIQIIIYKLKEKHQGDINQ